LRRGFFGRRVLDDLRAQVGRFDASSFFWLLFELQESLKRIWRSCFDLCIDDLAEEFAGGDLTSELPIGLVLLVEFVKSFP
jgi:hypothetical protein